MGFNQKAASWDSLERIQRAKKISDEIANVIPLKKNYLALEFGCGTGLISFNLMDQLMHITLTDTSKGMIDVLRHKIKAHHATNMDAVLGDINEQPELVPAKVDLIYSSMVMHHIVDTKSTVQNLYTLLNDQGYLCIVDLVQEDGSFHKLEKDFNGHNGFDTDKLTQLLENVGFHDISSHICYEDIKRIGKDNVPYSLFIMVGRK